MESFIVNVSASPNQRVQTPWGSWEVLGKGPGWQVKRLDVNPKQRLSHQSHQHRGERWIVVEGVATVLLEGVVMKVGVGSTAVDVARQEKHRLMNESKRPLVVIEVQFGEDLSEDDIIRYEDDYGRR